MLPIEKILQQQSAAKSNSIHDIVNSTAIRKATLSSGLLPLYEQMEKWNSILNPYRELQEEVEKWDSISKPYRQFQESIERWDNLFKPFRQLQESLSPYREAELLFKLTSAPINDLYQLTNAFTHNSWLTELLDNKHSFVNLFEEETENTLVVEVDLEKRIELVSPEMAHAYLDEAQKIRSILLNIKHGNLPLRNITSFDFEDLVAELLFKKGFHVEKTKRTRDGGKDMLAFITGAEGDKLKYVVECKHPKTTAKKIDVSVVRQFRTVISDENANKGLIVTSSYFTKDARNHANRQGAIISLKDIDDIMNWVTTY